MERQGRGFTNSASQNGDKLSTLTPLNVFAMQMGMILVGDGDLPGNTWSGGARTDLNRLGTWLAMGQSNADEAMPSAGDIDAAERFGGRVATIAGRLKDEVVFETERINEADFGSEIWHAGTLPLNQRQGLPKAGGLQLRNEAPVARTVPSPYPPGGL